MPVFRSVIHIDPETPKALSDLAGANICKALTNLRLGIHQPDASYAQDGQISIMFRLDTEIERESIILNAAMEEIQAIASETLDAEVEQEPVLPWGVQPTLRPAMRP